MSLNEQTLKAMYWVGLVFLPLTSVVSLMLIHVGVLAGCITTTVAFVALILVGEPGLKLWQRVWASCLSNAVR